MSVVGLASSGYRNNSLLITTGLRTTSRVLDEFNHMAFLYDPQWVYSSDVPSMPIAFIRVTGSSEVTSSTVATKRIISYRGTTSDIGQSSAQLQVIADNIINDPKEYKLEAVVPYTYAYLFTTIANTTDGLTYGMNAGREALREALMENGEGYTDIGGTAVRDGLAVISAMTMNAGLVTTVLNTIMSLITTMDATITMKNAVMVSLKALTSSVLADGNFFDSLQSSYNKNSLDRMASSRHVLTMKHWADWRYRNVVIKNLTVDKHPEDGDNYRVQLDVQELPVLMLSTYESVSSVVPAGALTAKATASSIVNGLSIAGGVL